MNWKLGVPLALLAAGCFAVTYVSCQQNPTPTVASRPMADRSPLDATGEGLATVAVLDVGQGDAILIRSPEGKTALIDAGPSRNVVDTLRDLGVESLDLAVVSHHHQDHYGGMFEVIKAFHPRLFLATDSAITSPLYLKLLELVRDRKIRATFAGPDARTIALGTVALTVFPKPPEDPREENNNSVGIRLQFGEFSMLLTGDSQDAERAWWRKDVPTLVADCNVLKLAHHGSRNGIDARWLGLVRPQLAVASLGAGNDYGHPHPETLALLKRYQVPLLRTDLDGTIVLQSDGKRWQVVRSGELVRGPPGPDLVLRPSAGSRDGTRPPGSGPGRRRGRVRHLIDLNDASESELRSIPGIGHTLARRIIANRPYESVDDLVRVEGFASRRIAQIRRLVTVGDYVPAP